MKKLLAFIFMFSSLSAFAQGELPSDTIKNRLSVIKQQVPSSPKESKYTGSFDKSLPEQERPTELPDSIHLDIILPEYVEPFPWADTKKIRPKHNPFEMDYDRYANYLLSPKVIIDTYSNYTTYPTMGSIIQTGAGVTYYSPNGRWELNGGLYAAKYTLPSRMHGAQMDLGLNASLAYRINDCLRVRAFGQYSAYGKSNSLNGYMNPLYPQSGYGMIVELKVTDWLELHGGAESIYDATKMKWTIVPVLYPVITLKKKK